MEKQKVENVEISKIVIKIGKKEIPLTTGEARELLEVLGDTLKSTEKDNTLKYYIPVVPQYPIPQPWYPPPYSKNPWYPRRYWDVTYFCDSSNDIKNTLICSLSEEK